MSQIKGNTIDSIWLDEIATIDLSQFSNITPSIGDISYNTANMSTNVYSGTQWINISSSDINSYTTSDTINFNDITISTFKEYKEFEDKMPDMHKIKEMCDMYPGFKKAFDHLRTIYNLIQDDYQERKNDF